MGKDARGLTWFWSNNCFVPDEGRGNPSSHKTVEAAANARNLTNPVVTLGAEVANPWGAVCGESRMHGFDAGVGKRARESTAPCPKRPDPHLRRLSLSNDTLHH
jgi:hypothetical protein